jgi:hypothetical protein
LESYRSQHLLPPPIHSPKERLPTNPLQVARATVGGRGLDAARFEALRNASRSVQHVVRQDLRKEVALRAHQSKQSEYPIRPCSFSFRASASAAAAVSSVPPALTSVGHVRLVLPVSPGLPGKDNARRTNFHQ